MATAVYVTTLALAVSCMDAFPYLSRGIETQCLCTLMLIMILLAFVDLNFLDLMMSTTTDGLTFTIGKSVWSVESIASSSACNLLLFLTKNTYQCVRFPDCYVVVKSRMEMVKVATAVQSQFSTVEIRERLKARHSNIT